MSSIPHYSSRHFGDSLSYVMRNNSESKVDPESIATTATATNPTVVSFAKSMSEVPNIEWRLVRTDIIFTRSVGANNGAAKLW